MNRRLLMVDELQDVVDEVSRRLARAAPGERVRSGTFRDSGTVGLDEVEGIDIMEDMDTFWVMFVPVLTSAHLSTPDDFPFIDAVIAAHVSVFRASRRVASE